MNFINKLKSKKHGRKSSEPYHPETTRSVDPLHHSNPSTTSDGGVVTFRESHEDLGNKHIDTYEKTEILPSTSSSMAPPLPPTSDSDYAILPPVVVQEQVFPLESSRTVEVLPTEVVEMPMIIHESIRQEQIEEIQPVMTVEREKTEIRQIVQPLMDKEVKPITIEERTLPVEVLPTIVGESTAVPRQLDTSTREFDATLRQVIEKTPIIQETEKWRIIEEVQPIIYREVIVPHIIRTNKAMREVIVEAPVMAEQVLRSRELTAEERLRWSALFSSHTVAREVIPATSIPIITIPDTHVIRGAKEIVTETTMTTTTTTAAPIVGSVGKVSTGIMGAQPMIVDQHHDVSVGPHGEKITTDTYTTTSRSNLLPTLAK